MTTAAPSRFGIGSTMWIVIVAAVLVLLAALSIYCR